MKRVVAGALLFVAWFHGCGSYDGLDQETGRQGILDQAALFLNSGMCDQAIDVLNPLYQSKYVDNEVRMTLASAYACKAEFSFPTVIDGMKNPGSDVYSTLSKALYSTSIAISYTSYPLAIQYVVETSSQSPSLAAGYRTSDANLYMILLQMGNLITVMNDLGATDRTTGKKTRTISSQARTTAQRCKAQVALSVVSDCLTALGENANIFSSFKTSIDAICTSITCSNLSYDSCISDATLQGYGEAILLAIDTSWLI
jgi:hypothetical protein